MELRLDPESLRDRTDVPFQTETRTVDRDTFETVRRLESHVTVGIVNDDGEVLLVADDARGWTLPAAPVGANEAWATVADRVATSLTGGDGSLDSPVRVRQVDFRESGVADPHTTYDVLVRATVSGRPIADDPVVAGDDVQDLVWLDHIPDEEAAAIADDVRSILDRSVEV